MMPSLAELRQSYWRMFGWKQLRVAVPAMPASLRHRTLLWRLRSNLDPSLLSSVRPQCSTSSLGRAPAPIIFTTKEPTAREEADCRDKRPRPKSLIRCSPLIVKRFDGDNCSKLHTCEKFKNDRIARCLLNASTAVTAVEYVEHRFIFGDQIVGDNPTTTPPANGFRTHDRARCDATWLAQFSLSGSRRSRQSA